MITIEHLDVRFEVEGGDDEQFARLFEQHIRRWEAAAAASRDRDRRAKRESAIGDRRDGGEP
jgi:hypothetical protein